MSETSTIQLFACRSFRFQGSARQALGITSPRWVCSLWRADDGLASVWRGVMGFHALLADPHLSTTRSRAGRLRSQSNLDGLRTCLAVQAKGGDEGEEQ